MRLKFIIIAAIALIAIACCASSCVESAQAQSNKQSFTVTRVFWDPMYGLKIYKVTTPTGTSYVLRDDDKGGLCTLK